MKQMTDDQRAVVKALDAMRCRLRMPVPAFCRQWTEHSADVYRRMLRGIYTGDVAGVVASYAASLEELQAQFAAPAVVVSPRHEKPFHHNDTTRVIEMKVREAMGRKDHRRAGLVLGPTGSGKTELLRHLAATFGGRIVGATEAWRRSYTEGLADIYEQFAPECPWRSRGELQRQTFALLRQPVISPATGKPGPALLLMDDSNTWGPHTWNMVRDIINFTPAVVIAAGLTECMDQLCMRSFAQASQVMKRALFCYELPLLTAADVKPFLQPLGLNGTLAAAADHVARQANVFGRYDLVERVCEALAAEPGGVHTIEQVKHATAAEQATIRLAIQIEHLRRHERARTDRNKTETTGALVARN